MHRDLNYNHLRHFWVVAAEGSLTRGARRLRLTHSTLSVQLKALEERFGQQLLVRRSRGVALTPFGEHVKSYCDEIFRIGSELEDSATDGSIARRPTVRVGVDVSLPRTLLQRSLHSVRAGADAPTLVVRAGSVDALVDELVGGRLHVVLADRPPATHADVHVYAHVIGEVTISLFGVEKLVRRLKNNFPNSLDGAPLLLPGSGTTLRSSLVRWCSDEGVRPRVIGEFDDLPLMKAFAAAGDGLLPIRDVLADEARRVYGLRRLGSVTGVRERIYALTLERRVRHHDVQQLIAECKRRLD